MAYLGFQKLSAEIAAHNPHTRNPDAIAAMVGRRKYGKKAMGSAAKSGKSLRYHKQLSSFVRKHG